jgi:hypothetical protein
VAGKGDSGKGQGRPQGETQKQAQGSLGLHGYTIAPEKRQEKDEQTDAEEGEQKAQHKGGIDMKKVHE